MGSFKGNGRGEESKRRTEGSRRRRQERPDLEPLENRRLLSSAPVTGVTTPWHPTTTNLLDAQHGPLANLGPEVVSAYSQYLNYVNGGSKGAFTTPLSSKIAFLNTSIGLDVRGTGDFTSFEHAMQSLGMNVTAANVNDDMVEGWVPLSSLPSIAQQAQTIGGNPVFRAVTKFAGVANNEAAAVLTAPAATTGFTGAGSKIGVISDSVNQSPPGLAGSVATGDLPANVQIIQDADPVSLNPNSSNTDEGRAMLENIHDIAPGASLAFATGQPTLAQPNGDLGFANNIANLAAAGANIIVDDLGSPTDLYYQDSTIQQAVNTYVANGGTYVSASGNAADSGYQSQFRPVSATVPGVGTGTFMNFDPSGATQATTITISVYSPTSPEFQFDQPVVPGSSTSIQSQVNFYVLDANNNVVGSGTANNVATQSPIQYLIDSAGNLVTLPVGTYKVAIQVVSGPNPGHVVFFEPGDGGFNVDHQYGTAGGTFYPTAYGHAAGASTISVGAVPWFNAAPYTVPATGVHNEDFSDFGPYLQVYNSLGAPLAAPTTLLKPDISAPDGGNTSFFGQVMDTTNPPNPGHPSFPGQPATTTGEIPTATNLSQNLPSFFGTSSAAPNVAAVIALMKQANPNASRTQILTSLESSATPVNGATKGVWNQQGGYGLINAVAAIKANATLTVQFISPGANQTVGGAPTSITVFFSQPVNIATVQAANLVVAGPNGSTVTVGAPVGVDSPTFPTQVRFPITITPRPGTSANGTYYDAFIPSGILSQAGAPLSGGLIRDQFNISQSNGPSVVATSFVGRIVTLTFNEAVNPATINPGSVYLFRAGGTTQPLVSNASIVVSQLPGAVFSYNAATFTVTLDLTGVAQSLLPTDQYCLIASNTITDAIGNPLNGFFTGVFPSGLFPEFPNATYPNGSVFVQQLGIVQLTPPLVSSLTLAPASDSGIPGDGNTNVATPSLVGQITSRFPGSLANQQVYVEFNGISHPGVPIGTLDLAVGAGGRGFVGHYDVVTTTNALGQFTVFYPPGVLPLPEGENRVRVVVVGQPDSPPLAGLSSSQDLAFRIDRTDPYIGTTPSGAPGSSIPENANINSLPSLTLNVIDPVNPQTLGSPFAVAPSLAYPAIDPTLATNTQNYRLFRLTSATTSVDLSSFITSVTYTSTSARVLSSDPYTGQIVVNFAPGLPAGQYQFFALSSVVGSGLSDAAGNPFAGYQIASVNNTPVHFLLDFNLQPTPTYITNYAGITFDPSSPSGIDVTGARANYELPLPGITPRATAPPNEFIVDFSNPLNPNLDYSNIVQLVRSADTATAAPDGNFGDLGITNTSGYTRVPGVTVTLGNAIAGAVYGQYGFDNRLTITLAPGFTLPADYYRIYMPNSGPTAVTDVFGNQLDGEFLGYQNANFKYVDQLQTGQVRGSGPSELPDLSGDGTPGGAFMTGFVVVPNGNIIYARADAIYNPQIPSQTPDGSAARPYPVLAPEAIPTAANGGNLNSPINAGTNFNPTYDRSGDGQFEPSAFYAAQLRAQVTGGPVVIIAEQSIPSRDPSTGAIVQKPFVLQAPSPSGNQAATSANDASAAVPAMTTLILGAGTILKMQNAALLVQNQGSALQVLGGPNSYQTVNITSYKDSTVGGVSNGNPASTPSAGDYGGILFRNYDQGIIPGATTARTSVFPGQIPITNTTADQRLKGPFASSTDPASQTDAISGADDVMSYVSFLVEKYAGGAVPQTLGVPYDGITLQDSRPTIVNTMIAFAGGTGSAVAGLSVDVDSLRADDVAMGPLVRNDQFVNNGLNGIYIRAQVTSGLAQASNAIVYPTNPATSGGARNYVLDDPYPYLLTSRLVIGDSLVQESGGTQTTSADRLYVDPGMIVKFELGAGVLIDNGASLNVGDQTYIRRFDGDNNYGPGSANFKANSAGLAQVIFTSLNDDTATTSYFDPVAQTTTTLVQPLAALPGGSGTLQPTPGNVPAAVRWGSVVINAGAIAVINSADFRYGGGVTNLPTGSTGALHVLEIDPGNGFGANVMVTNNTFTDNLDVPINLHPNALMAGDPETPLESGDPFLHGNIFERNGFNGVGVQGGTGGVNTSNLDVNSVWTGGDFTYILRNTIVLGPDSFGGLGGGGILPTPDPTTPQPEPTPNVVLTLQSTLPGTVLADGTTVAAPGVPLVIKLLGGVANEAPGVNPAANVANSFTGGAGFLVGVDNGIFPPAADTLVDPGAFSQLRIVGIGANQTTGQSRVPVIITSVHDSTVGTTVNNVVMNQVIPGDTKAPAAGDGGVIYFGGESLTDYNLLDPRDGNIIDNADIKYITRVEQQGGGIIYTLAGVSGGTFGPGNFYNTKLGLPLTVDGAQNLADQYNQAQQLTISNSNLSTFSDAGFIAHPGYDTIAVAVNYLNTSGFVYRLINVRGQATHTFFVNDTISNMRTGAEIISETSDNAFVPSPAEAVFLNDTFYNDAIGIHTVAPAPDGVNALSHVASLTMDSIFSNISGNAIQLDGQDYGSEVQYNLFFQTGANLAGSNSSGIGNDQPILGDPAFRNAAAGNFFLLPNSRAIDAARSEIGPTIFGDMIYPAVNVFIPGTTTLYPIPIRNEPVLNVFGQPDNNFPAGDVNPRGGLAAAPFSVDIVTLPGLPVGKRGFPDQWIPVLVSSGLGTGTTAANAATYNYVPIEGQRDQVGDLRVRDPNTHNPPGFGSNPFLDLGAFEYIIQNPPLVDGVLSSSIVNGSGVVTGLYGVGTVAGTNKLPLTISVIFSQPINPATLNGMSVILQASGGDGIFGNANSPADRTINLSGLLSYGTAINALGQTIYVLTINTAGIFASNSANDEYRLILKGTGSSVIRNTDGLALDGDNLDANGAQLPLPSGVDQFPGSDFQVTFTIDTNPPSLVAGTFKLDPASDSSGGKSITNVNLPTFDGTITDIFPPANPLAGQQVFIDVSTLGNGVFDLLNAGTGVTNANGTFSIKLTKPIPNTPNTVGTDGIQGDPGATYTQVRVRVVDQAGNASNTTTGTLASFVAQGAVTQLQEDTKLPRISAFSPLANTVATVNASGQVVVTVTFNKNIKTSTLNAGSILVFRTGGTGSFGGALVQVPIVATSFTETYLDDATGSEMVTFAIQGPLPNDQYEIILKGTGATPITDIAGNPLSGAFTGTFPTGSGTATTGSDFINQALAVYQPGQAHLIYVQAPTIPVIPGIGLQGTRENPFPTIGAAMAVALIGDDVLVLPGTYKEDVTLKAGVRLLSADLSSTDTTFLPGSALQTLIYGVAPPITVGTVTTPGVLAFGNNSIVTLVTSGSVTGIPTEVSGFSIISPLIGDPALGTIDPTNIAILAVNSNVSIDRDIILNAGFGMSLVTSIANVPNPNVFDNLVVGNINGIGISSTVGTASNQGPVLIVNNTIADNTVGLVNSSALPNVLQAWVLNDIFYANHDLTTQRGGTGIYSLTANTLGVGANLFYTNGASDKIPASNAVGLFGAFNPAALTSKPDVLNNFIGNPAFVSPKDPRPNGDTPGVFYNYGNYDLTGTSAAINAANNGMAPATDFLYRTPVKIAGHGFANTGPASIGAFYYKGTGGPGLGTGIIFTGGTTTGSGGGGTIGTGGGGTIGTGGGGTINTGGSGNTISLRSAAVTPTVFDSSVGGGIALGSQQFGVITTSLSTDGTLHAAGATELAPGYIDINFSDTINPSSVSPTDLVLSGSGLNPTNPAKATSLAWIDDHAIRFFLTGGFNSTGTVNFSIQGGAITDNLGAALNGFIDSIQLTSNPADVTGQVVSTTGSVTPTTLISSVLPVVQPVAASAPVVQPIAAAGPVAMTTNAAVVPTKVHLTKAQQAAAAKAAKQHAARVKAQHAAQVKAAQHAAQVKAAQHAAQVKAAQHAAQVKAAQHAAQVKAAQHAAQVKAQAKAAKANHKAKKA